MKDKKIIINLLEHMFSDKEWEQMQITRRILEIEHEINPLGIIYTYWKPTLNMKKEKKITLESYLKEKQKTWTKKDWFWWYYYWFESTLELKLYPLVKLYCRIFGHSKRFKDECERCGIDL